MKTSRKVINQELDLLFKTQFHGAVNIRGIRYQILYSILRAFDLYNQDSAGSSLRLEGIEDVDLLGLRLGDEYVQVKSSKDPWNWSKLKEPIQRFLRIFRVDPRCHFLLTVDFPLRGDIARLAQIESLPSKEKNDVMKKFRNLCRQIEASTDEADDLASRLIIVPLPEEQIWSKLRSDVVDAFGLGSEAVDTYISALVARFLNWAKDRKTVTRSDLDNVRAQVGEALARETEFQAYGRGLIDRISWEQDANVVDFFEGKGTRPGHIVTNVDVRRPAWLERIDRAINSSKICILKSSSGQGKSALLYRYAHDEWLAEDTFILKVAESPEQAALVRNYLRFRVYLGSPVLLLIDNAGWQTRLWPSIAQDCAALGVRVLVTVRSEDWHRFARESLMSYEILEPSLDLDEARQIFKTFKSRGRIHASVDSPEWAYERIGEPHLLMEYVYLLTHGRMLEERLRDQVKQFSEQKEDPAKVEILRRAALADAVGAPVLSNKLLQDIPLRGDPQEVLKSLSGEYLKLEGGILTGLHWVRSDHLVKILHEGHPNLESTALATLEAVPSERIPTFISNVIRRQGLNVKTFLEGLVDKAKNATVDTVLVFLSGIFEAGERQFFAANRGLFDDAYELIGPAGPFLFSSKFMPIVKSDAIDRMVEILGDKGGNFQKLQEIASKVSRVARGLDLCRNFLGNVSPYIHTEALQMSASATGRLLDWCSLCDVKLSAWPGVRDHFFASTVVFDLPLEEFCSFTQGLYRYDEAVYQDWFTRNREGLLGYLKLHTECVTLNISDDILSIGFFPDGKSRESVNDQAVSRLNRLRSAIPFCQRYQSKGIWVMPFGLKPSVDETIKDMPRANLPFESDIKKNAVWWETVESHYLPDSYYRYEEAWNNLRHDALLFVQGLSKWLQRILVGQRFNFQAVFEGGALPVRLAESLKRAPDSPPQSPPHLRGALKGAPKQWSSSFQKFFFQTFQYIQNTKKSELGQLAVHNFLDAVKYLPDMHSAFAQLFKDAPDYFSVRELNANEIKVYTVLADLLEAWVLDPPKTRQRDILLYLQTKRTRKRQEMLRRIRDTLAPLEKNGMTFILPPDVHVNHPIRYLPLAFSVNDLCHLEDAVALVIKAIAKVKDVADFFCLVPIYQGTRFLEGGYQVSSNFISELENGRTAHWETLVPHELPENVLSLLPSIPFQPLARFQICASVLALLGEVQSLAEWRKRLARLKASRSRFEIELYDRYTTKLRDLERDLSVAAARAKDCLEAEFPAQKDNQNYKTVRDFLKAADEAARRDTISDLLVSDHFKTEDIEGALEQLLDSTD